MTVSAVALGRDAEVVSAQARRVGAPPAKVASVPALTFFKKWRRFQVNWLLIGQLIGIRKDRTVWRSERQPAPRFPKHHAYKKTPPENRTAFLKRKTLRSIAPGYLE
jgi:hypothetical protein